MKKVHSECMNVHLALFNNFNKISLLLRPFPHKKATKKQLTKAWLTPKPSNPPSLYLYRCSFRCSLNSSLWWWSTSLTLQQHNHFPTKRQQQQNKPTCKCAEYCIAGPALSATGGVWHWNTKLGLKKSISLLNVVNEAFLTRGNWYGDSKMDVKSLNAGVGDGVLLTKSGGICSSWPRAKTCGKVARIVRTTFAKFEGETFTFHNHIVHSHFFPSKTTTMKLRFLKFVNKPCCCGFVIFWCCN